MEVVEESGPCGPKPIKLDRMPPEVLGLILDNLVPEPPEIGETRPVAYDQLAAEEPWFEYTRRRRGLRSACLVSRRLRDLALPLLYRNISVWNETSLVLLFRTLFERPDYGRWTRYMSCHMTLTHFNVIRDMRRVLTTLLPTFNSPPDTNLLTRIVGQFVVELRGSLPHMFLSQGDLDDIPQMLLCFTLAFFTKLETLMMQIPVCDDDGEYEDFCREVGVIKDLFASDPDAMPFQHIHTLQLQGDPELIAEFEEGECDCDYDKVWGSQAVNYALLFNHLPKLATLEVSGDDGSWSNLIDGSPETAAFLSGGERPPPYLERIKHIYLHDSAATPRDLHHLLLNAPNLETLYMFPRPGAFDREIDLDPSVADSPDNNDPESLDNAFAANLAPRLRNLDISWDDLWDLGPLIGPDGRLPSLATMTQLETLFIQLVTLYGSHSAFTAAAGATTTTTTTDDDDNDESASVPTSIPPPLIDLLPPNLVELALEDYWWRNAKLLETLPNWSAREKVTHYQSQAAYRAGVLRVLGAFANAVRAGGDDGNGGGGGGRMARLKKVALVCRIPWTWVLEGAVPLEFHFENVKAVLAAKGVAFEVRCDEVLQGGGEGSRGPFDAWTV